jgi:hypothetical protein
VLAALAPTVAPTDAPNNAPILPPKDPIAVNSPVKNSFIFVLLLYFTNLKVSLYSCKALSVF